MDHSSMMMSNTATAIATATSAAASSTSTAMHMDMDMGGGCKISMLWNWYTIDACFISPTWRIRTTGAFAGSCIGVVLLVVSMEFLRRLGKEYDAYILRQFQQHIASQATRSQRLSEANANFSGPQYATFRATPLQQLIRSIIHAVTFGVAYIIMLLAMYYNGYIIISIFIGAGLGKFITDWMVHKVPMNITADDLKANDPEEPTVCCG